MSAPRRGLAAQIKSGSRTGPRRRGSSGAPPTGGRRPASTRDPTALDPLVTRLASRLLALGGFVASAESCTGGLIAKLCTDLPGSSRWFDRGLVTYSNESKRELLGVREATLRRHGAVSEAVAREMVRGILGRSRATVAVAVTGIAGPDGGTPDKPVGTVWFAWGRRQGRGFILQPGRRRFRGDRDQIRRRSAQHALRGLLKQIGA